MDVGNTSPNNISIGILWKTHVKFCLFSLSLSSSCNSRGWENMRCIAYIKSPMVFIQNMNRYTPELKLWLLYAVQLIFFTLARLAAILDRSSVRLCVAFTYFHWIKYEAMDSGCVAANKILNSGYIIVGIVIRPHRAHIHLYGCNILRLFN